MFRCLCWKSEQSRVVVLNSVCSQSCARPQPFNMWITKAPIKNIFKQVQQSDTTWTQLWAFSLYEEKKVQTNSGLWSCWKNWKKEENFLHLLAKLTLQLSCCCPPPLSWTGLAQPIGAARQGKGFPSVQLHVTFCLQGDTLRCSVNVSQQ